MSESPEEQPSTGVLGRIGSWFSPWRARGPKSPPATSPTSEQPAKSEGEHSGEGEKAQSSNPNLASDISPSEGDAATRSGHRDDSALCGPETAEGGPSGEESARSRENRGGQGEEREESSDGISESGNPEKNASRLTHLSSSSEQGVVQDSAQPQAQGRAQAQTGRRLHVYVEETSVVAGQPAVHTKVTRSCEIPRKLFPSLDSPESSSSTSDEKKRADASPAVWIESDCSGFEGVSFKSIKIHQFEPVGDQSEADIMGRRNATRKKSRKNIQGDGGTHETMPPKAEPASEGLPTSESSAVIPEGQSPKALKGGSPTNSSSKHGPASRASPEPAETKTSCPEAVKQLDEFKESSSVTAASLAVDGPADMEDDDSLYKVERKTETPESKRRSMKISRSELKLFTKNVSLKPKPSPEGEKQDVNTEDTKAQTETDSRPHDLKTTNEERKPAAGRIADRISLFERTAAGFSKQTSPIPRSADASPVRKAPERLRESLLLPEPRSRSAERCDEARSSSASPPRERLMTIKERTRHFAEASERDTRAPPKAAMTGMSKEFAPLTVLKSEGLNSQDKLDAEEQMQSDAVAELTPKPDKRDAAAADGTISTPKQPQTDSRSEGTAGQGTKPNRAETDPSEEPASNVSQQSKSLSRPGSRSKRRRSREPTSPTSPNSENQADLSDVKQTASDAKGSLPDERPSPSPEEKTLKKEGNVFDKQVDASFTKDRPEPERLDSKDEPDTAAAGSGTTTPIDEGPDILAQREERARGHGRFFTEGRDQVSTDSRKTGKPKPPPRPKKQESPVQHPKSYAGRVKEPSESDTVQTQQPQHEEAELINQVASIDAAKLDNADGGKEKRAERKGKETPRQLRPSDETITLSDGGGVVSGTEGRVERQGERQNAEWEAVTRPGTDERKPQSSRSEPAPETPSDPVPQTQAPTSNEESPIGETATNEWRDVKSRERHSAETRTDSAFVGKTENAPDDSWRGANEASSERLIPRANAEEATVKATNGAPAQPADGLSCVQKPSSVSASESVRSEGDDVKPAPSEVEVSGVLTKPAPVRPHGEASEDVERRTNDAASAKAAEKTEHVGNGEIFLRRDLQTVKKKLPDNKTGQTLEEAKKPVPDSVQRSSLKNFSLPRGLGRDDSAAQKDVPSSWLDLDFPMQRLKVSAAKLTSSGSESNLLDPSGEVDDDDFVKRIKSLCAPFSLPPRKHHPLRPPQPPFAMPAIREDRLEKPFDPDEFKFGLSKRSKFTLETTPSQLAKLQASEAKSGVKPARASLVDRSIVIGGLDIHSRLKGQTPGKGEEDVQEEKDEQVKVKSRLEGSSVFSRLASSFRGKREGPPMEAPLQSPPPLSQPSPAATAPLEDALGRQSPALSSRQEAQSAEAVGNDSGPPLPSFNDSKLPDYFEKYLPGKPAKPARSVKAQERVRTEIIGNMSTPASGDETDQAGKPGLLLPEAVPPFSPGSPPPTRPTIPEFQKAQGTVSTYKRTAKGFHKRPGKMMLFEKAQFSGEAYEIHRDVADATSMRLSPVISVKVVRGCWVLYEKPDFQGRPIALEEGGIELTNVWAEPGTGTNPNCNPVMVIGSIRLAVSDYSVPRIDLFTEPEGLGRVTTFQDDAIEAGSFGIPLSTASIQVHSGVWLLFSDPGYEGMLAVLETGVYPFNESWGFPSPFVGSLRPLKMGGFKVENPNEVKAVVYEKPGFDGSSVEIDCDVFGFRESEGRISADAAGVDSKELTPVGSLKIERGLWVGFSEPGFEGQQHILEEGEYLDCSDWGGSDLVSLRPLLSDFLSPHLKMFSERDFSERGINIDVTVPVIDMDDTGYGTKTQSIDVIGGIWVVFDKLGFCGEPYVLERGLYGGPEDWGALQPRIGSAMPVVLEDFENEAKFKVQLFSEPGFQGAALALQDDEASLQGGFSVASCRVLAGSWLAFEEQDFAGRMYVLEAGGYADLRAMGCVHSSASIRSLQTVGFEFSLPSITLFERAGLRGKRVILTDGAVNLQLAGGCSRVQSVLVEGGIWVLYEGINYRGAQILLKPGEVPDWRKHSSWLKIGSLRPLLQKQVHFRLRNRCSGLLMTVTGDLDDVKLLRIQETEETGGLEQIWSFQNGDLHCKLLEDCCLSPSSGVTIAGSRVGLTLDHHTHLWSITPQGFICYTPTPDLVLEVKGGHHYDKNLVILNALDPNKVQQQWNVEVI